MTKPVLIAQISDLHIKAPGELAYGKVDTAAALSRCIVELNRFSPALILSSFRATSPIRQRTGNTNT